MAWQVPDTDPSSAPASLTSLTSSSAQSTGSSSLELGPTPGSGMDLDSHSGSLTFQDSGSETETLLRSSKSSSVHKAIEATESGSFSASDDTVVWSAEVEKMLNNPPPEKFRSFNLSMDPSLSSWIVPASDNKECEQSFIDQKTSITPVVDIDQAVQNNPSNSPSPYFPSSIEPLEDFTGHLAGGGPT